MTKGQLEISRQGDVVLVYSLRQTWLPSYLEAHIILGVKVESRTLQEKFSFKATGWVDLKGNSSCKLRR